MRTHAWSPLDTNPSRLTPLRGAMAIWSFVLIQALPIVNALAVESKNKADSKGPVENAKPAQPVAGDRFEEHVRPLLSKFCISCHGKTKPKAGLNLAELTDGKIAAKKRKAWNRVRESLETTLMPPEGRPQPNREEVAAVIDWLDASQEKIDCAKTADPGRVTMRRLNRAEYRNTIRDLTGVDFQVDEEFPSDDVGYGFDNIGDVLTLPPILLEKYLAAAGSIAEQAIDLERKAVTSRKILFRAPSSPADYQDCAREVLERFLRRAYRRPITGGELSRFLKLFNLALENGDSYERGIELAVQAALVAPQFLFRVELLNSGRSKSPRSKTPVTIPIGEFELASRLSYFLWSSMPDAELFQLAEDQSLSCPEVMEPQVRRMLKDPKAQAFVENFAGQWLQLRNLKTLKPDAKEFPTFGEPLRQAMVRETELFFGSILNEDRSLEDFLAADYTFVNERLAKHYGLPNVKGDQFRKVSVPGDRRGGLITQASILTVTSNPTRTSPVKRGKWILEQILGTPPPPPPPNVPELDDSKKSALTGTLRQRMEQHRANASCASCHSKMDPLGFGLENYDAVGAWRDKDGGFPIDASGTLPGGQSFQGVKDLKVILDSKKSEFTRCLAEKVLIYAIGRGLEDFDACSVDKIVNAVEGDSHRFSRLILEVILSEPFQRRRS